MTNARWLHIFYRPGSGLQVCSWKEPIVTVTPTLPRWSKIHDHGPRVFPQLSNLMEGRAGSRVLWVGPLSSAECGAHIARGAEGASCRSSRRAKTCPRLACWLGEGPMPGFRFRIYALARTGRKPAIPRAPASCPQTGSPVCPARHPVRSRGPLALE